MLYGDWTCLGSSAADTIRTIEGYADCIVLRHNLAGSAKKAAAAASVPIINAGDGPGQHPTQVLHPTTFYTVFQDKSYIYWWHSSERSAGNGLLTGYRRSWMCTPSSERLVTWTNSGLVWWGIWPMAELYVAWRTYCLCTTM